MAITRPPLVSRVGVARVGAARVGYVPKNPNAGGKSPYKDSIPTATTTTTVMNP